MTVRRAAFLLAIVLLLVPSSASASGRSASYVFTRGAYADPSSPGSEWTTPFVVVPQGSDLYLVNLRLWGHSMYSDLNRPDDRLFWSAEIPFGKSTLVNGVSALAPGSYGFFCSNHPDMKGTLLIVDP
ncbi:MAG: hypothetical protein ABR507_09780 [Actinomycetota bacterium]|nr:cupredoxin domain-containing protein [Actinomycetota bacterium]